MKTSFPYKNKFYAEQDYEYQAEQNHAGNWRNTKRVMLNTWTIYEYVGSPAYQTPRHHCKNKEEAEKLLATL